jgi:hypothetical protein
MPAPTAVDAQEMHFLGVDLDDRVEVARRTRRTEREWLPYSRAL